MRVMGLPAIRGSPLFPARSHELAKRFTKGNHAYIVCTHIGKAHIHNRVIRNSTALSQTRKFRSFWGTVTAEHGRSAIIFCIPARYEKE